MVTSAVMLLFTTTLAHFLAIHSFIRWLSERDVNALLFTCQVNWWLFSESSANLNFWTTFVWSFLEKT